MSSSPITLNAWRVDVAGGTPVLVSVHTAAGYEESISVCTIPGSKPPWRCLVTWQRDWIPLLTLEDVPCNGVLVLNLYHTPGMSRVALPLSAPPQLVELDDADCEHFDLGQCGLWSPAAISGVCVEGECLPIIDPDRLVGVTFVSRWRCDSVCT